MKKAIAISLTVAIMISMTACANNSTDELTESSPFESGTQTESEGVTEVGVDVLDYDGHSFACFFGCSTWEEARDQCEGMGGHLAVITSQEEDEALFAFTRYCGYDNVYIGYSDIEEEGNWQWVTGETFDYSNWNEGEPNGFTTNENYAVYGDNGAWYDGEFTPRIEDGLISFICEWDYHVDGATNISSEELQTYIDGLEAVAIETEPVVETLSQTDVNRIAAYAGYLDYLEASESPIRSCNMYDQNNCALADVTGDGIEELFVFKQHYYGYTFLEVMTYDFSAGEVRSILSTDNNWDFYYLYMFAISNAGNLIICNYSYQACPLNAYFVYTYDGNALVETEALFHSGIEWGYEGSERYVAYEADYRINRDYVTENEYSNREAEILNSISSILVDSIYWNNIQGDPDVVEVMDTNQMNAVVSSVEKIAMTYDEMHALLASYLPTPTATPEPTEVSQSGNMVGIVEDAGWPRFDENGNPDTAEHAFTCNLYGVDITSFSGSDAVHINNLTDDYRNYETLSYGVSLLVDEGCTTIVVAISPNDYGDYRNQLPQDYPNIQFVFDLVN